MHEIRILVVARIRLYRDGLADALARREGIEVVGTADTPDDALERVKQLSPDIVILEAPSAADQAALQQLARHSQSIRVIVLGLAPNEKDALECVEAGAAGYVSRDDSAETLVETIHAAARGELRCSPSMAGTMLRRLAALSDARNRPAAEVPLTAREREILALLAQALSNKEIASRLGIGIATVKNHVHHLLEKLQVRRRAEAALRARQQPV
jgi:DNA-binding NarL/FixJ family response regulator